MREDLRPELERFEMFAYKALRNDGWDDIEVDYYHDDRYPHGIVGVPIFLIKNAINEDGEVYAKYRLFISGWCSRDNEDSYRVRLEVNNRSCAYKADFLHTFYDFEECYEEALAIVKKDELTEQALEISNGKYHTKVGIGQLPSEKIFENILHTN